MGSSYHCKDSLPLHLSLAQIYSMVTENLFLGSKNVILYNYYYEKGIQIS